MGPVEIAPEREATVAGDAWDEMTKEACTEVEIATVMILTLELLPDSGT